MTLHFADGNRPLFEIVASVKALGAVTHVTFRERPARGLVPADRPFTFQRPFPHPPLQCPLRAHALIIVAGLNNSPGASSVANFQTAPEKARIL